MAPIFFGKKSKTNFSVICDLEMKDYCVIRKDWPQMSPLVCLPLFLHFGAAHHKMVFRPPTHLYTANSLDGCFDWNWPFCVVLML